MKNKKNVAVTKLIPCLLISTILSGCLGGREINDLEIVVGIGIDKDTEAEGIMLTAQVVKPGEMDKSKDAGGNESKAFWNVRSAGHSIFDAARQITQKTGNRLFVSHTQVIIFGEYSAKDGIQKYFDFFLRSHEMRPTVLILVSKGKAADIMDIKSETEKFPAFSMVKLVKSYGFTSQLYKVNVNDFTERLMSMTTSPIAPIVYKDGDDIRVSGMAVFKNDKMAGTLSEEETRGLLWVLGKVKSGILQVNSPLGKGKAFLEITDAKSDVVPEIKDGKVQINIKISEKANLSEQSTVENLATATAFKELEKNQKVQIKREIMAAFDKSRELNCDIFGFGDFISERYHKKWKDMESKWDSIYQNITLKIDIQAKVEKTDLLTRPAVPGKEG